MSYDEPLSPDSLKHDEVDPESLLSRIRRFVACNGVCEISGAFQPDDLDRVDVISSIDATLNISLDLRTRMHKTGCEMLR
jgi:hypothetical protein